VTEFDTRRGRTGSGFVADLSKRSRRIADGICSGRVLRDFRRDDFRKAVYKRRREHHSSGASSRPYLVSIIALSLFTNISSGRVSIVCLLVCLYRITQKTAQPSFTIFGGKVAHEPRKKLLDFGGNPDIRLR